MLRREAVDDDRGVSGLLTRRRIVIIVAVIAVTGILLAVISLSPHR